MNPCPSPAIVLETHRLRLRLLTADDAPFVLALVNEPDWLRYIGDRGIRDLDGAREYIRQGPRAMYARHRFGLWLVERREDGEPLGLCGLLVRDYLPKPDIGFALRARHHGHGYAREAAEAVVAHACDVLGLPELLAIVSPGNVRSVRLLEHLGFRHVGEQVPPGADRPVQLFARAPLDADHPGSTCAPVGDP